jgi:hypothetical protein
MIGAGLRSLKFWRARSPFLRRKTISNNWRAVAGAAPRGKADGRKSFDIEQRRALSREIKRNGGYDRYRAAAADENAWRRGGGPKDRKLTNNRWLRRTVARKLESDWSPEQIAGWLKAAYPEDEHYQVSHETIYRSLYVQARGVLKWLTK